MMLRIGSNTDYTDVALDQCNQKSRIYHISEISDKGLTLIEVLLAVSILAIGVIGVLRAYAGSIATLEAGQLTIDAINLMNEKISDIEQGILEGTVTGQESASGTTDEFNWEWDIASTDIEQLNELAVTVTHAYSGRELTTKTYITEKEEEENE